MTYNYEMQKVVGIGGIFFKAKDPEALKKWYVDNLGIPPEESGHMFSGTGETVWSPFPMDTEYFAPGTSSFMINYRVEDLQAMLSQLRANGVQVEEKFEEHEYGNFGWATDPEGNRFELWQPK